MNNGKVKYVLGFLFNPDLNSVVLIRKAKPQWQAGKFNGVGGKIEEGETPEQAMRREFLEETGLDIGTWEYKGDMVSEGWDVAVYAGWSYQQPHARTTTVEEVIILPLWALATAQDVIGNLRWLIPLVLDKGNPGAPDGGPQHFHIQY